MVQGHLQMMIQMHSPWAICFSTTGGMTLTTQSVSSQDIRNAGLNKNRIKSSKTRQNLVVNAMYLPALLLLAVFLIYPFIKGLLLSFTDWNGYNQTYDIIGLQNYTRFFKDANVLNVLKNTFIYGAGSTLFQNILGLALALLLDQKIKCRNGVKVLVYLPAIISGLIMGYVWYYFFQYDGGAINDVLALFKIAPLDWLSNGNRAVWIITLVNTFQYVGVAMLIFLAGLQNIPKELHEAASIDGATAVKKFRNVTLPLLMPAITISVVQNIIGGLKLFDVIMAMTKGGPGDSSQSLSTLMYTLYFVRQDAGYAAAVGNIMFLIICVISTVSLLTLRSKEVEM